MQQMLMVEPSGQNRLRPDKSSLPKCSPWFGLGVKFFLKFCMHIGKYFFQCKLRHLARDLTTRLTNKNCFSNEEHTIKTMKIICSKL